MSNITLAVFGSSRRAETKPLYQYDYGQVLQFKGVTLPSTYEVHFSNTLDAGSAKTQIGNTDGVMIPDEYLTSGADVYAFVYLHTGQDDGETEYVVHIPVNARPQATDAPPTPEEQSVITQTIAALNATAEEFNERADEIEEMIDEHGGVPGKDGFSPAVTVLQSVVGALVTITDAAGSHQFLIKNGTQGQPGKDGEPGADGKSIMVGTDVTREGQVAPPGNVQGDIYINTETSQYFEWTVYSAVSFWHYIGVVSWGEENVIETVKVNGAALVPDENKAVNVEALGRRVRCAVGSTATFSDGIAGADFFDIRVELPVVRSGSGTLSPSNPQPFVGQSGIVLSSSGADTSSPTQYTVTFPVEAGANGTVYVGKYDVTTGVLTVTHKLVKFSEVTWQYFASNPQCFYFSTTALSAKMKDKFVPLCSHYQSKGAYNQLGTQGIGYIYANAVAVRDTAYADLTAWNAAVADGGALHDAQILYELETLATFTLTPHAVTVLAGENNIWSDRGVTFAAYESLSTAGIADGIRIGDTVVRAANGITDITAALKEYLG